MLNLDEAIAWVRSNRFKAGERFVYGQEGDARMPGFVADADCYLVDEEIGIIVLFDRIEHRYVRENIDRAVALICLGMRELNPERCVFAYDDRWCPTSDAQVAIFTVRSSEEDFVRHNLGIVRREEFYSLLPGPVP